MIKTTIQKTNGKFGRERETNRKGQNIIPKSIIALYLLSIRAYGIYNNGMNEERRDQLIRDTQYKKDFIFLFLCVSLILYKYLMMHSRNTSWETDVNKE